MLVMLKYQRLKLISSVSYLVVALLIDVCVLIRREKGVFHLEEPGQN